MARLNGGRAVLVTVGTGAVLAAGAAAVAARRDGVSTTGWLVTNLLVPLLYGKRDGGLDRFFTRIAAARSAGPALPPAKVRKRYDIMDTIVGGTRVFRVAPRMPAASPLRILYLHGGAYVFDLMASQWPLVTGLVDSTGATVVAAIYPLAPEHQVGDALAAVEAVYRTLADEVGARNVVIAGDSAGGGLALALSHRLRDGGADLPAGLILYFPWLDANCTGPDQPALERIDPALSIVQLREAGRMWSGDRDDDPRASPLFADHAGLPPTLVLVGTRDLLLSDARRFAERHPAAIVREYPGMFHGWVCAPIPEARRALHQSAAFIARHAGTSA